MVQFMIPRFGRFVKLLLCYSFRGYITGKLRLALSERLSDADIGAAALLHASGPRNGTAPGTFRLPGVPEAPKPVRFPVQMPFA